jgi:hypothetical protein
MSRTDDGSPGIFALERFDWAGPDRLELHGTFTEPPPGAGVEPLLVVYADDGAHELPLAGAPGGEPLAGERWQAEFAWQEPPAPFVTAELVLGDLRIALPGPYEDQDGAAAPDVPAPALDAPAGGGRLHLETELLAAREHGHEAERELERARAELDRARADLAAERAGREQDAARFREGLAAVERAAAEELEQARAHFDAAEDFRARAERLRADLEAADARNAQLRERLEAASEDVEQALGRLLAAVHEPDRTAGRL